MDERAIVQRLNRARGVALEQFPFFGRLLLHLRFGLSDSCETAFTDMQRIVFNPEFAIALGEEELQFVLLHEVLHCALKHCTRARGKAPRAYNVACDIVVNSLLLELFQKEEMIVYGEPAMHLTPTGEEGRTKTAEEVYAMLLQKTPSELEELYGDGLTDDHELWKTLGDLTLEKLWDHHLKETAASCPKGGSIPLEMERYLKEIIHTSRTNWRQVLHSFIQFSEGDYVFSTPDKRFSAEDFVLPSFCDNICGSKVEKIWFLVDTSGSINNDTLAMVYAEIRAAMDQVGTLSGQLSFFSTSVTEPISFDSAKDLSALKPIGGGGTDFYAIFDKLRERVERDQAPKGIVILTDGYAWFPREEAALGIPVIWAIVESDEVPPWGEYIYIGGANE